MAALPPLLLLPPLPLLLPLLPPLLLLLSAGEDVAELLGLASSSPSLTDVATEAQLE